MTANDLNAKAYNTAFKTIRALLRGTYGDGTAIDRKDMEKQLATIKRFNPVMATKAAYVIYGTLCREYKNAWSIKLKTRRDVDAELFMLQHELFPILSQKIKGKLVKKEVKPLTYRERTYRYMVRKGTISQETYLVFLRGEAA